MSHVLDASAVLAWLHGERGAERVEAVIVGSQISTVNLAEVLTKVVERGGNARQSRLDLEAYGLVVQSHTADQAEDCAELRPLTRSRGLSLGDRACLALGRQSQLPILTAERIWADLDVGVPIIQIRE